MVARQAVFAFVFGCLSISAPALAQSAEEREEAREHFREGVSFAQQRRWEDAESAFTRAYAIVPAPQVLLNLAGAQTQTGHLVEAADNYRRLTDDEDRQIRRDARRELDGLRRRIPSVTLEISGLLPDDEVELDGQRQRHSQLGEPMRLNPGEHTLRVRRDRGFAARERFELAEGDNVVVELAVDEEVEPEPDVSPENAAEEGSEGSGNAWDALRRRREGGDDGAEADPDGRDPEEVDPEALEGDQEYEEDDGGFVGSAGFWILITGVLLAGGGAAAYLLLTPSAGFEGSLGSFDL